MAILNRKRGIRADWDHLWLLNYRRVLDIGKGRLTLLVDQVALQGNRMDLAVRVACFSGHKLVNR